ncbi:hypothetical protein TNIN_408361 [Trichonephila inaurata madagascariensis]|uniref:Uncharacterized protein n=1 Tax=Trichonephila inaurata madagascariensis TaxID=2747483 RepID=A0A8X6WQ11_9ARAC|nr:hypothetical protein TNIN_408361 [Trichonephila inaurata madagascariensis]
MATVHIAKAAKLSSYQTWYRPASCLFHSLAKMYRNLSLLVLSGRDTVNSSSGKVDFGQQSVQPILTPRALRLQVGRKLLCPHPCQPLPAFHRPQIFAASHLP